MRRNILLLSFVLHLPIALLALSLPWHHSRVDRQFVATVSAEIERSTDSVIDYAKNPPWLTDGHADVSYLRRAADDINAANDELDKYEHNHATREDVKTAMTQLAQDLADIPPAHWPPDIRREI